MTAKPLDLATLRELWRRMRKMHPPPIWLGRPRDRRPEQKRVVSGFASLAAKRLRRLVRRESPLAGVRKLIAEQKRTRRQRRNQRIATHGGIYRKATAWLNGAA